MMNTVFRVSGDKVSALLADEEGLKFSSAPAADAEDFRRRFAKKISLATQVEIKYDAVKAVKKEDGDAPLVIKYRALAGLPGEMRFSFNNPDDTDVFFRFLEKDRYFTRTHEGLTPFRAVRNYGIGLTATVVFTAVTYRQALKIANGTLADPGRGKVRVFNWVVGWLGEKGVLAVGALTAGYLLFKIWKRFSNPPSQTRLLPPNA